MVSKLLQSGEPINFKQWVAAVDLTADRVGLVLAHDLQSVIDVIEASDEPVSPEAKLDRVRNLKHYAISEKYLGLRRALGIAVDA